MLRTLKPQTTIGARCSVGRVPIHDMLRNARNCLCRSEESSARAIHVTRERLIKMEAGIVPFTAEQCRTLRIRYGL